MTPLLILQALILSVVEGITEFLPISSTGHMILVGQWIGFEGEMAKSFEIFIQLGAILAVVVLYWRRFLDLFPKRASGAQANASGIGGVKGITCIALGCGPVFVLGALLHGFIKRVLFTPTVVSISLIVGGLIMIFVERKLKGVSGEELESMVPKKGFLIGLFQCAALVPGVSRSGSTLLGGMLNGFSRKAAAEYSFLLAVPVMCAAVGLDLVKSFHLLSAADIPLFAIGFVGAFLSALIAIRGLMKFLGDHTLVGFAIYRIILGVVVLTLGAAKI